MSARLLLATALLALPLRAADEAPKSSAREALKARLAEDAKKETAKQAAAPAPTKPDAAPAAPTATMAPKSETASAAKQPATVLPQVEIRRERITELDVKIADQERAIAREQKNTKASEVDVALNDAKIAKPLSIFGGESAQFRKGVASERVELLEAEKDILEAMKLAKTKEEKAALQKQLDDLRAVRRELEKTLR